MFDIEELIRQYKEKYDREHRDELMKLISVLSTIKNN